jgi:hypothetical protein
MLLLLSVTALQLSAQQDSVQARFVLVGDAGLLKDGRHPIVSAIRSTVKLDSLTTILFLGDNLYTYGLPDDAYSNYSMGAAILDSQINVVKNTSARAYFIPGNHDWNHEGPDGWNTIMREQNYVDIHGGSNVEFYPKDGCPGPVQINIGRDVVMILMDSQWWLHLYDKPGIESDCPYKTKEEVLNQIDDIVSKNSKKLILFASHHPMKSDGIHGGYYTLKQHLFPLTDMSANLYVPMPLIGSIYPITRGIFGTPQDLKHPAYRNMINDLEKVLKHHPNVIFAAGHEHNMQLIQDSSYNYIISGSGTNKTRVSKSKHQLYGAQENGFAVLEVLQNKLVNIAFYEIKGDSVHKAYANTILDYSKLPKTDSAVKTSTVTATQVPFEDSVLVSASEKYGEAAGLKKLVLGDNYREEWGTKVKLKVFDISKVKGGMTIQSLGGGKQTTSLRMKDKDGREWTLRTIDKNPENAIPEALRGSIAQHIVEDMVSASHPYGALTVPMLASAANVIVAKPEFYFVPDDPAFGIYRSRMANTVCMLEEREPTPDKDTKSTQKVMSKILDDNDNRIDQPQVLRARLLDMLIGDWDRHLDQWHWATRDTGKGKLYYAVPKDRDQVFFNSDGLLAKIVSTSLFRYLTGFSSTIKSVNWFNWEERDIDRFFLNRLDRQRWSNIIDSFRQGMTDSVIIAAVNQMPPEIVAIDGNDIIAKLQGRRDHLAGKGMDYYKFLANTVTVLGTNDKEYFKVTTVDDTLTVKVYKRSKNDGSLSSLMYERKFDPKDTREIWMYGLNNDDYFEIDEQASSRINIRIIGGKGNDTFNVRGNVKNYLYDLNTPENAILSSNRSSIRTSADPHVNDYSPVNYRYNLLTFPKLMVSYNPEDKLLLGFGAMKRTFGFRQEPYATEQKFSALYAFGSGAYRLKYQGDFNHAVGNLDLLINTSLVNPVLDNFFGLGNETVIDKTKDVEYYRVRYKYLEGEVLLRKRFNSLFQVMAGPMINHYWDKYENNADKILGRPSLLGLDSSHVYALKTYLGLHAAAIVNNLDNVLLPTRGINWRTDLIALRGLNKASNSYYAFISDMQVHAALTDPAKLVTVVRLGGGRIFSKTYEYFQALSLGANNFLRGFRKDRFAGTGLLYGSVELRMKLFESKSYIVPGAVGVTAFNELGRVWLEGEHSRTWHHSYGGGLYYAAYNLVLLSANIAFSKEDQLFNFSIGTRFNITF